MHKMSWQLSTRYDWVRTFWNSSSPGNIQVLSETRGSEISNKLKVRLTWIIKATRILNHIGKLHLERRRRLFQWKAASKMQAMRKRQSIWLAITLVQNSNANWLQYCMKRTNAENSNKNRKTNPKMGVRRTLRAQRTPIFGICWDWSGIFWLYFFSVQYCSNTPPKQKRDWGRAGDMARSQ